MRDWKTTALNFDKLVFDQTRKEDFSAFGWTGPSGSSLTDGFALPTYVVI